MHLTENVSCVKVSFHLCEDRQVEMHASDVSCVSWNRVDDP